MTSDVALVHQFVLESLKLCGRLGECVRALNEQYDNLKISAGSTRELVQVLHSLKGMVAMIPQAKHLETQIALFEDQLVKPAGSVPSVANGARKPKWLCDLDVWLGEATRDLTLYRDQNNLGAIPLEPLVKGLMVKTGTLLAWFPVSCVTKVLLPHEMASVNEDAELRSLPSGGSGKFGLVIKSQYLFGVDSVLGVQPWSVAQEMGAVSGLDLIKPIAA